MLVYPTLAVALLTAAPDWYDRIERLLKETFQADYAEETELVAFMRKNPECVASPIQWVEATDRTKVDGTICSGNGDVWLRIEGANGVQAYKGIDIAKLLNVRTDDRSASTLSTVALAFEADQVARAPAAKVRTTWRVAQDFAVVVCQQFSGSRIIRHLRSGNDCYDEVIDSRTGVVISKQKVPCRNSCSRN